jgi:hypothetical protein
MGPAKTAEKAHRKGRAATNMPWSKPTNSPASDHRRSNSAPRQTVVTADELRETDHRRSQKSAATSMSWSEPTSRDKRTKQATEDQTAHRDKHVLVKADKRGAGVERKLLNRHLLAVAELIQLVQHLPAVQGGTRRAVVRVGRLLFGWVDGAGGAWRAGLSRRVATHTTRTPPYPPFPHPDAPGGSRTSGGPSPQ